MKLSITYKMPSGFAVAFALIIANVVVSSHNTIGLVEREQWVTHTQEIIKEEKRDKSSPLPYSPTPPLLNSPTGQTLIQTFGLAALLNLTLLTLIYYLSKKRETTLLATAAQKLSETEQEYRAVISNLEAKLEHVALPHLSVAEVALRESENRLRAMIDAEPEGVQLIAADGTLLEINAAGIAMLEVENADAVVGRSVYALIAPEYRAAFRQLVESVCQLGNKSYLEFETIGFKGVRRWLEIHAVPLCQDGVMVQLAVTRDITERKNTQQQILEQAALLDVATDAIVVRDIHNRILFWNKAAERLYGWQREEVMGLNTSDFLYKDTSRQLEDALMGVANQGEWHGELQQVTKDGKQITVESRWTLVRDEKEQPKSILTVSTEITQKKELEAQFLRSQRIQSIGTLAGGIAHDLNNVLAPVLMSVQLLQMRYPDEQNQQLLKTLERNVKRGADLVKQVLSFARGLEGKRTIVQVKHLLLEIEHIARETFPKYIEFRAKIPGNIWTVSGDATQLHQVLMNLVVNARDAMPDGGTLSICAENLIVDEHYTKMHIDAKEGAYIVMTVTDTGTGIPPEILDRIFEPFFTTKDLGQGTGLGLSTVMGIVKSHGGFMNVYSEVGKGTRFKVYLPALERSEIPALPPDLKLFTGSGELVLVVDDEPAIREITRSTLEAYNYRVVTASDGVEALAVYAQHQAEISVVLLDMMMPAMDGAMAIRTLQKMNPLVKIIAISGLVSNEKVAEAAGFGVKAFLSKPCTAKELLKAINVVKDTI